MLKADQERALWLGMAKAIAHDMGTPLSSIMGWLEMLPAMKNPESAIREINSSIDRLNLLSQRLELLSPPVKHSAIPLHEAVDRVIAYFSKRLSDNSSVTLKSEVDSSLTISVHPALLEWALECLVKNAIDALQEKGGEIRLSAELEDESVLLNIIDDGCGMPDEDMDTIFSPGYTTKRSGRGIGLPLARYIVEELLGGRLDCKLSLVDQGTNIEVALNRSDYHNKEGEK